MHRLLVLLTALAVTLATPMTVTSNAVEIDESRLAAFVQLILEQTAKDPSPAQRRAMNNAWNMLCLELRDVDCTGVAMPRMKVFKPNPMRPGLMGYYDGTDIIYIRSNLYSGAREEVIAHEMSHYLDQMFGLLPPMPVYSDDVEGIIKLCKSEATAWAVSDEYNRTQLWGNPRRLVGSDWVEWYTHCTPYRDVLYPPVSI